MNFQDVFDFIYCQKQVIESYYQDDIEQKMNYLEFTKQIEKISSQLDSKLLDESQWIGLKIANNYMWFSTFWALVLSGYKVVLIDKNMSKENLDSVILDTNLSVIIEDQIFNNDQYKSLDLKTLSLSKSNRKTYVNSSTEIALCTSATTGFPKVVIYHAETVIQQIKRTKKLYEDSALLKKQLDFRQQLNFMGNIPFHHCFGFFSITFSVAFRRNTGVFRSEH